MPFRPRPILNNNPLCIRRGSSWLGLSDPQDDPQFCQFATMMFGQRATIVRSRSILDHKEKSWTGAPVNTLEGFVRTWNTPGYQQCPGYIDAVCALTGYQYYTIVDNETLLYILWAMAKVETSWDLPLSTWERALLTV